MMKVSVVALVILGLTLANAEVKTLHLEAGDVPCKKIPVQFCTADLGCELGKDQTCEPTRAPPPPLNCTAQFAKTGAAVSTAAKTYITNLKAQKDLTQGLSSNTSKFFDVLGSSSQKYDNALKSYNESMMKYIAFEGALEVLQDDLSALEATCAGTEPPPPVTCPTDIAKVQMKIASMNASIAKQWIDVSTERSLIGITSDAVKDAEVGTEAQIAASANQLFAMQTSVAGFLKDKNDALAYWEAIDAVCTPPAPPASTAKTAGSPLARLHKKAARAGKVQPALVE